MEGHDISDGACDTNDPHRAGFPAQDATLEDALYGAIREAGGGSDAGKEQFVRLGEPLAAHVARHLLRQCPSLLDPAMADPHASVEEVAEVILDVWYEALFGGGAGWRLVRAPAAGARPSAYLWEIAKHHLLRREDDRHESLESRGEAIDRAVARRYGRQGRPQPRAPGLREEDAWEYVRQTDGLSQSMDGVARDILREEDYLVFHDRVWGAGDDGKRMTYREIGERHGISEEAARKRFNRAQARVRHYAGEHPEDERVKELGRLRYVGDYRLWGADE